VLFHILADCHSVIDDASIQVKRNFYVPFKNTGGDIRISNQFVITSALHFAQKAYYQASVTITLGRRV